MSATLMVYGVLVTVGAYALSRALAKRYPSPFTTPVFFSTTLIVLVLLASGLDFEDYRPAKDALVVLLGPATVALAVPIFKSTVYQWLVVSGAKAQYKGSGMVNDAGDYGFLLTATDGNLNGGGGADKFRIKIWDKASGGVVYDNVIGASDDLDAASPQAIASGSIVIHK